MKYDVTIGIPVFNAIDFIKRSLESALSQSYNSIEFLIVDDGSQDGSADIIKLLIRSHPKGMHLHLITHTSNKGVSFSRNEIIDKAQGDYLYFLDSDDVISKDTISLMMENVRKYDAEIVFGSYERIETAGERNVYQYPSSQLLEKDALANFAYRKYAGIQASSCNYLVKISILRENHLRFIDTNYWEDLAFTFDLVTYISSAVLLSDITYSYLCRENSLSHYQKRKNISKEEILKNVYAIEHLKNTSSILYNKVYYPNRCYNIVMTDFYIACNILKRRKDITPSISNKEIKTIMYHPATWSQICSFQQSRYKNMILFIIGKLPSFLCVATIWILGKLKKLF
jgi:glycosyltransferase involved in cell wall biosynthesis